MKAKISSIETNRRQFLTKYLPLGILFCMGCKNLFALTQEEKRPKKIKMNISFSKIQI